MNKIIFIIIFIAIFIVGLLGFKDSKAQSRSKYMDLGDKYIQEVNNCKFCAGALINSYATAAVACYIAAIAEK